MTETPKPLAIAATYCDALASVHSSMHGTNEEVAVGLMLFFDTIHKRDPRMMPIVIAAWQKHTGIKATREVELEHARMLSEKLAEREDPK